MKPDKFCIDCGAPISKYTNAKRCITCAGKQHSLHYKRKRESYSKEHKAKCVVCGKDIPILTPSSAPDKTCSVECFRVLLSNKVKHKQKQVYNSALAYIKEKNRFVYCDELMAALNCTKTTLTEGKLHYIRLNRICGFYLPGAKTAEQLRRDYIQLLQEDRTIKLKDALSRLQVSAKYLEYMGIRAIDLRRELGLFRLSRTQEEVESTILNWMKTKKCYCTIDAICRELHMDYYCCIKKYNIDVAELNRKAGHKVFSASYPEDNAYIRFCAAGFDVKRQKSFPDCVYKKPLKFDFWFPDIGVLVEIDGAQHYTDNGFNCEAVHRNDSIKNAYVAAHDIPLFRVRVTPVNTYLDRLDDLIHHLQGLPRVNEEVHTDSNCGELPPGNAEDNPQPSLEDEPWDMQPDLGF